jgi:hypothetical protein
MQRASTTGEAACIKAHKTSTTAEAGGIEAHKASTTAEAGGSKMQKTSTTVEAACSKAQKPCTMAEEAGIKAHTTAETGDKSVTVVDSNTTKTDNLTAEEAGTADAKQHAPGKNAGTKGGKAAHHTTSDSENSVRDVMTRFEMDIAGVIESKDTTITNMQNNIAQLETANNDHASTHKTLRVAYEAKKASLLHAETQLLDTQHEMSVQQNTLQETEVGMVECQKQLVLNQQELANEQKKRANLQMQNATLSFDVDQLKTRVSVSEEENKRNRQKLQEKNSESSADAAHYTRVKLESADTLGTLLSQVQRHLCDIEKNDEKQARILTLLGEKHSQSAGAASLHPKPAVPIAALASFSLLQSAAVGGSVVGGVGPL